MKSKKETPLLKPGTEFVVPEEWKTILTDMQHQMDADRAAIETLAGCIKTRHADFWELIKNIFPETKDYSCNYNKETHVVKILYHSKKED